MSHGITEKGADQRWDDLDALMLPFRERLIMLEARMTALGVGFVRWETYRSPERSAKLVREGKSKSKGGLSMHCFGIAADYVCPTHHWDCFEHKCDFYFVLRDQSQRCGLTHGSDWDNDPKTKTTFFDWPHVQGVPANHLQDEMRAAHLAAHSVREAILLRGLRPVLP